MNKTSYSAWNPGIESEIPKSYRSEETIYHRDKVFTTFDQVQELSQETGLSPEELITFRSKRLALHELIVRVNADIVVKEGDNEEDLGINFRIICEKILADYISPKIDQIESSYQSMSASIRELISTELDIFLPDKENEHSFDLLKKLSKLFNRTATPMLPPLSSYEREHAIINGFNIKRLSATSELESAVYRSIHRVLGSILTTRGFIGNSSEYLIDLCTRHCCNFLGSDIIGQQVGLLIDLAVADEGYSLIADATQPILISLKGASAAGKSSLRPVFSKKMRELGIEAKDYGTISPDIWRRMLLDYDALGEMHKYAGRFSSHEVNIIDKKLDRYIRKKAQHRKSIPHLLVDRFRFDSFASEKINRLLFNTYVKYVDTMYMYFIVAPPEATVERGWERGLERGRYKSVEDFLGHCIEAYAGMPKLLFKWLSNDKPTFCFEFLDNSVTKGEHPKLIAKGTQDYLALYLPEVFVDIERYQRINIKAKNVDEVYPEPEVLAVKNNLAFLRQCIAKIECIDFVDPQTEECYLNVKKGKFEIVEPRLFEQKMLDQTLESIVSLLSPDLKI